MCGRITQSGGPLRYAIVDGMNVRDSRVQAKELGLIEHPGKQVALRQVK